MFAVLSRLPWRKIALACAAFAVVGLFSIVAFAQVTPSPQDLIGQLVAAASAHEWLLFTALIVGFVVALTKQGWLGTWLQSKFPSAVLPYWAMILGFGGTFSIDVIAGKTWQAALFDGFSGLLAAFISIAGHQTVIEHMRAGKELLPRAPWMPKPPAPPGTGPANYPQVKLESVKPQPPSTAKRETLYFPKRLAIGALACVMSLTSFAVVGLVDCTPANWQNFQNIAEQFITYVSVAVQGLQALWAILQPLIPAAQQAQAVVDYNNALLAVNSALAGLQDAVQAGNAVQQAPANYSQLASAVQDAFAQLFKVVTQWQSLAPSGSAKTAADGLQHQASKIAAWRMQ